MIARQPRCSTLLSALLLAVPALHASMASAQISAAPGGPAIGATANGVPLVQINAPNAAGVSHNQFQNYNVGANGLVLNNSANGAATQIGGNVAGNAALANGAAGVILNEVVGNSRTMLNGTTEIAGQRAALIVANPNGISVDGGSVLNASRVTLTTGTPTLTSGGSVSGFTVAGGDIAITGRGFDASTVDKVDLLSRSMKIDAAVRAKDLIRAVAGRNDIAYDGDRIDAEQTKGTDHVPVHAIDVAALGGMYANAISLRSTEGGAGVNIAGKVQALTGDLKIEKTGLVITTADQGGGKASDDKAGGETVSTEVAPGFVVAEKATEDKISVRAGAQLLAAGATDIRSNSVDNAGAISGKSGVSFKSAVLINDGTITSDGDIKLNTATLRNTKTIKASGTLTADTSTMTNGADGTMESERDLSVKAATLTNDGVIRSNAGNLNVDAVATSNNGTLASATGTTKVKATTFTNSGKITASQNLSVNTTTARNEGTLSSEHGNLDFSSLTFTNVDRLSAKEGKVKVQSMIYSNSGTIEQAPLVAQVKPVEPSKPVEQAKPVEPTKPVEQAKPVEPSKPVEQAKPVEPTKPVEQAKPVEPTKPVEQAKPVEPTKPVEQAKPIEPAKPVQQAKPAQVWPVQQAWPVQQTWTVQAPAANPWWQATPISWNTRWY
ncbi:filamentous hemagglutinin N-terminal domain-containing protein [Cupriavidus basilensis]|uniref:Filamentous hemagglutinin N-terminal domain-containing protein n=1 Tax=Cupriavidus basilensis TaxID=68895 RepID=A0A7M2GZM2_9BURK|nr:filamentous hemagglutinin N-terminal domain-containing protein [Cupriavidus basilensis]QOT78048.1 filamentous hemagglutinin N-terminal domain-containing protein [Cupriavidus basilensis]